MSEDIFRLVEDPDIASQRANRLFAAVAAKLAALLPAGAIIEHIGATAIPGCETKGDLDITIRVAQHEFDAADRTLSTLYDRNTGSIRTTAFSAFEDEGCDPHLGIQLVVAGSEFDIFTLFRDRLLSDRDLVAEYNALKREWQDRPMEDYRRAKGAFIEKALAGSR